MKQSRTIGHPPIYSDAESLKCAIDNYFANPPTKTISTSQGSTEVPNITITGLCIALGFESRQSFYDYEKRGDFSYIIKRARLFIESDYESLLQTGQCTGAIFALKNMGWKDTQVVQSENKEVKTFSDMYDQ